MKFMFVLGFILLCSTPARACDWANPTGMTSDWVEDKVIFWGRAIETKWDKSGNSDFASFNIYTNIEVIEQIKGNLPKEVRVYHAIDGAACGFFYQLGSIELIVLPQDENGHFRTGTYIQDAVNKLVISAYVNDGVDLPVSELAVYGNPFFRLDNLCKTEKSGNLPKPDYCKWEMTYKQAAESYSIKRDLLIESNRRRKWWQNLEWGNRRGDKN